MEREQKFRCLSSRSRFFSGTGVGSVQNSIGAQEVPEEREGTREVREALELRELLLQLARTLAPRQARAPRARHYS